MMYQTKIDLPESIRQNVINLLQKRLCDGIDFMHQAKHAHWNVKGPNFIALHELFDDLHEQAEDWVDLIAERTAQLGGIAEGTSKVVAKNTSLPDYPATEYDEVQHIEALSNSLAVYGKMVRHAIEQADQWRDVGTADIFTQISRSVDKNLWLIESHLWGQKTGSQKVKGVA